MARPPVAGSASDRRGANQRLFTQSENEGAASEERSENLNQENAVQEAQDGDMQRLQEQSMADANGQAPHQAQVVDDELLLVPGPQPEEGAPPASGARA